MKKRRELDALVNGKLGRRKKSGQHELLHNDTDSSDVEEFSIPQKTILRKQSVGRLCSAFFMVCGCTLLLGCVVAIGGLVWIHIDLKHELDSLKSQMKSVEIGNSGSNKEYDRAFKQLKSMEIHLRTVKGNQAKYEQSLEDVRVQIASINNLNKQLSGEFNKAAQLKDLPADISSLKQNAADLGSSLSQLQGSVELVEKKQKDCSTRVDGLVLHFSQFETYLKQLQNVTTQLEDRVQVLEPGSTAVLTRAEVPQEPVNHTQSPDGKELLLQMAHFHNETYRLQASLQDLQSKVAVLDDRVMKLENNPASAVKLDTSPESGVKLDSSPESGVKLDTSPGSAVPLQMSTLHTTPSATSSDEESHR